MVLPKYPIQIYVDVELLRWLLRKAESEGNQSLSKTVRKILERARES